MQHFPSSFHCLILWSTTNVLIIIEFFMFFGGRSCRTWNPISAVHLINWANKDAQSQNIKTSSELLLNLNTGKKTGLKRPSSRLINEAKRFWNLPAVDCWTAPSTINKSPLIFAKCHTEWDKCAAGGGRNNTPQPSITWRAPAALRKDLPAPAAPLTQDCVRCGKTAL